MNGIRARIGDPVKAGFLTLYLVGYTRNGRLLRDAAGTQFYASLHYNGVHKVNLLDDSRALQIAENAAPHDPIVKAALRRLSGTPRHHPMEGDYGPDGVGR